MRVVFVGGFVVAVLVAPPVFAIAEKNQSHYLEYRIRDSDSYSFATLSNAGLS